MAAQRFQPRFVSKAQKMVSSYWKVLLHDEIKLSPGNVRDKAFPRCEVSCVIVGERWERSSVCENSGFRSHPWCSLALGSHQSSQENGAVSNISLMWQRWGSASLQRPEGLTVALHMVPGTTFLLPSDLLLISLNLIFHYYYAHIIH